MAKKPITIRFEDDEVEKLDSEADDRGFGSRTDYLRWIINNRDSIDENTTERLAEIEKRLDKLESNQSE